MKEYSPEHIEFEKKYRPLATLGAHANPTELDAIIAAIRSHPVQHQIPHIILSTSYGKRQLRCPSHIKKMHGLISDLIYGKAIEIDEVHKYPNSYLIRCQIEAIHCIHRYDEFRMMLYLQGRNHGPILALLDVVMEEHEKWCRKHSYSLQY